MKALLGRLLITGIHHAKSEADEEKTKLVNGIAFLGVPICLTYAVLFYSTGFHVLSEIFLAGEIAFTATFLINSRFGLKVARVYLSLIAPLFFGTVNYVAGYPAGFYMGFITVTTPALIFFDTRNDYLFFGGLSVLLMLLSFALQMIVPVWVPIPFNAILILINVITVIGATLSVVFLFKEEILKGRRIIQEKQTEIIDSINYAKRIQYALLAHDEFLQKHLRQHMVYFRPKDIVSGDFYWATEVSINKANNGSVKNGANSFFYLAVCDSTGHGVPGAFMSLLNISFLNEAINEKAIYQPDKVLNYVRYKLANSIGKEGQQDGFDGILFCMEKLGDEILKVTYAAANNAPLYVRDNKLFQLPCDRMPVGQGVHSSPFLLYEPEFQKGDVVYAYTDGFADQFGGPKGKKYKYKTLNAFLLNIHSRPLKAQPEMLRAEFEMWKQKQEQVDDVCILAFGL